MHGGNVLPGGVYQFYGDSDEMILGGSDNMIINVQREKFPEFKARIDERAKLKKQKRWADYRKMVAKVSDGGELTATEIDKLEDIAETEHFDPVMSFMGDVETLKNVAALEVATANYDSDGAALEQTLTELTTEMRQLKERLAGADYDYRQAESKLTTLGLQKGELARTLRTNPRLFDVE